MSNTITDRGYKSAQTVIIDAVKVASLAKEAASIAALASNMELMVSNASAQQKIKKRSLAIEQSKQKHAEDVYWPKETSFGEEYAGPQALQREIEDVSVLGKRYAGRLLAIVNYKYSVRESKLEANKYRYETSTWESALTDLYIEKTREQVNARVIARLIAESEYQAKTDVNYARALQALSTIYGMQADPASFLSTATRILGYSGDRLSAQFAESLGSNMRSISDIAQAYSMQNSLQKISDTGQVINGFSNLPASRIPGAYSINPTGFGFGLPFVNTQMTAQQQAGIPMPDAGRSLNYDNAVLPPITADHGIPNGNPGGS